MTTKQYDNYADLITFTRGSSGTALRPVGYGAELAPSLSTWSKVGDAATTLTYNSGNGSLDVNAATILDGAQVNAGLVTGKVYLFEADITLGTATIVRITVNAAKTLQVTTATSDTISLVFLADDPTVRIDSSSSTGTFTINSASVKEVIFDRAGDPLTLFNHPTNVPRIEYDASGNRKGLLIEEARTNLFVHSQIDNAAWSKSQVTVQADATVGPDGTLSASKLVEDTTNNFHFAHEAFGFTLTADAFYTCSVFAKKGENNLFRIQFNPNADWDGVSNPQATFDLNTGTFVTVTGTTVEMQNVGNGWYRCSITAQVTTASAFSTANFHLIEGDSLSSFSASYTGDGTSGIYVWGVQLEAGSFPTSYIPTSGSTATRSADVASIPTSAFGYNSKVGAGGTVIVDFQSNNWTDTTNTQFSRVWNLNPTSGSGLFKAGLNNGQFRYRLNDTANNAVFGPDTISSSTALASVGAKIAIAYTRNDFALYSNGSQVATDNSGLFANELATALWLGSEGGSANFANGYLKSIQYYPRRLTNAQLVRLTA